MVSGALAPWACLPRACLGSRGNLLRGVLWERLSSGLSLHACAHQRLLSQLLPVSHDVAHRFVGVGLQFTVMLGAAIAALVRVYLRGSAGQRWVVLADFSPLVYPVTVGIGIGVGGAKAAVVQHVDVAHVQGLRHCFGPHLTCC